MRVSVQPLRAGSMKTVAIISQKGGVGKTTLATALAVAAEADGRSAAVFDLDPQASASFWKDTRGKDAAPAVVSLQASRLRETLAVAEAGGCEIVFIDAPPVAKDIAFEAAEHADFILIPTRPAVLDAAAMDKTLKLIRAFAKPSAVVLTFCPTQGGREIGDTEAAVRQLGATLAPVRIHNRITYSRAQQTGQVAQELEPDGKAAEEIRQLYAYTCMHVFTPAAEARHVRRTA